MKFKSKASPRILSWKLSENFQNNYSPRHLWAAPLSVYFYRCLQMIFNIAAWSKKQPSWNFLNLFALVLHFLKVMPKALKNIFVEVSSSKVSILRKKDLFPMSFKNTYRHDTFTLSLIYSNNNLACPNL